MDRLSILSVLVRATALVALVVAESMVLEKSELAHTVLESAQVLMARTAGLALRLGGLDNTVDGIRIASDVGALDVTEDCVGLDIGLFLGSAMFVHPAPLRSKLLGFAASLLVVTAVNWLRVVTLALLLEAPRSLFDVAHYYAWPGAVIAACIGTYLLWSRALPGAATRGNEVGRP